MDAGLPLIGQPYHALLELEARGSGRTVDEHLGHILSRRYGALRRICDCGFFVYESSDDLRCGECGRECCAHCSVPEDSRDVCLTCRPGAQGGGFRR